MSKTGFDEDEIKRASAKPTWMQPVCDDCFAKHMPSMAALNEHATRTFGQSPFSIVCCQCGVMTRSGLFIRIDPRTVPYPSFEAE